MSEAQDFLPVLYSSRETPQGVEVTLLDEDEELLDVSVWDAVMFKFLSSQPKFNATVTPEDLLEGRFNFFVKKDDRGQVVAIRFQKQ